VGCIDYDVTRKLELQSWTQGAHEGGVDILWVIDDSMSMTEEQEELASHTSTFVGFLSNVAVDFRMGVTRTDMDVDDAGALIGELLTTDTPEIATEFAAQVASDTLGSREERGFDASLMALDPTGPNAGTWSEGTDLEVIFFSDEDDHSQVSAVDYTAALAALRPEAGVVVNAIVGDLPEGCASLETAADPAEAYLAAQENTGGARESICTYDYDGMLERVALHVLGLTTSFGLDVLPDPSTLEVWVDDVAIHQRDRHGWRYEPGDNTLRFDGYAVPPPGAEIVVRYYEWNGSLDTGP